MDLRQGSLQPTLRTQCLSFMAGSLLFALGSAPYLAADLSSVTANVFFFTGSWFFTAAAFLQLALSGGPAASRGAVVVVRVVWLAAAVQLLGTILFNVSTGAALQVSPASGGRALAWVPTADGSVAFLISAFLSALVFARRGRAWAPRRRAWWTTWLNVAGSVAFGVSAAASIVTPAGRERDAGLAGVATFVGALCFFAASALALPQPVSREVSG